MAPDRPAVPFSPAEQFQVRPPTARFDQVILFVGFARMLPFPAGHQVDLPPSRRQRSCAFAADAEQDEFRDVAEIEADAPPVRSAVLADFVPDDVGLVLETPGFQDIEAVGQKRIGNPQIAMRRVEQTVLHRQA